MKALLICLVIALFPFSVLLAQTYKSVVIERKKSQIDQNNTIYIPGRTFVYDYQIIKDGQILRLADNSFKDWTFSEKNQSANAIDAIKLVVIAPKHAKRTNKKQTEIIYASAPLAKFISSTGLVENDRNIWLHPVRTGFFKSLETCPFPYLQYPLEAKKKWTDQMSISNFWANELWGNWDGQLLLQYTYQMVGETTLETELGRLNCWKIEATAKSKIGQTQLTSYFSEKYGFVQLHYELATGIQVQLTLKEMTAGPIFSSTEDYLANQ
jgi:hypothetical protein